MDYLLDTGILLRVNDPNDAFHAEVRAAVETLESRGDQLLMSLQNVAEFWNVSTRPSNLNGYGFSVEETEQRLQLLESSIDLLSDTPDLYSHWRDVVVAHQVRGVQVHDARLAALMRAHGMTHLLTLNAKDFKRFIWLTVISPSEVLAAPPPPTPQP